CEKQPTNCWLLFNNFSNNLLLLNAMFHCSPPVAHWTKPGFTKPHSIQLSFACFTILFILSYFSTIFYSFSLFKFKNMQKFKVINISDFLFSPWSHFSTFRLFFHHHLLLFQHFYIQEHAEYHSNQHHRFSFLSMVSLFYFLSCLLKPLIFHLNNCYY